MQWNCVKYSSCLNRDNTINHCTCIYWNFPRRNLRHLSSFHTGYRRERLKDYFSVQCVSDIQVDCQQQNVTYQIQHIQLGLRWFIKEQRLKQHVRNKIEMSPKQGSYVLILTILITFCWIVTINILEVCQYPHSGFSVFCWIHDIWVKCQL